MPHLVAARLTRGHVEPVIGKPQVLGLEDRRVTSRRRLQREELRGVDLHRDPVDIRQLVALCVDGPEIGIAHKYLRRVRLVASIDPRIEARMLRIVVPPDFAINLGAGVQAAPLHDALDQPGITQLRMKPLQIMTRSEDFLERGAREHLGEKGSRIGKDKPESKVIDDLKPPHIIRRPQHPVTQHVHRIAHFLEIKQFPAVPIIEVGRGERLAVRPAHPLAQVEGPDLEVIGGFVRPGHVRDDRVA